jgi:hypothetical protein
MAINCGGPSFLVAKDFLMDEARPKLIEMARKIEMLPGTRG